MSEPHDLATTLTRLRAMEEIPLYARNPAEAFRDMVMTWQIAVDTAMIDHLAAICEKLVNEKGRPIP